MPKRSDKKKSAVIKRIAAKRLRGRQKRQRTMRESFEARLERLLGDLDQKEVQGYLLDSAALLEEPELDWVRFPAEESARVTKKFYEEHRDRIDPPPPADGAVLSEEEQEERKEARGEALERVYSEAISRLAGKPLLFRLKNAIHTIAKRAKEEGKRELMMQAICAEAMFRADVHVSAHPVLIVAYERARDTGLGEELPSVRGHSLLAERKAAAASAEAPDKAAAEGTEAPDKAAAEGEPQEAPSNA
jgi:hypothetical protein